MLLTDEGAFDVDASLLVDEPTLADATGWDLKPEGLCRADVCVPTRAYPEVHVDGRIDLRVIAQLLDRPLAVDAKTGDAVLGESAAARAAALQDARIDDLVLNDFDGKPFSWSTIGRKKKVLVAWASW